MKKTVQPEPASLPAMHSSFVAFLAAVLFVCGAAKAEEHAKIETAFGVTLGQPVPKEVKLPATFLENMITSQGGYGKGTEFVKIKPVASLPEFTDCHAVTEPKQQRIFLIVASTSTPAALSEEEATKVYKETLRVLTLKYGEPSSVKSGTGNSRSVETKIIDQGAKAVIVSLTKGVMPNKYSVDITYRDNAMQKEVEVASKPGL